MRHITIVAFTLFCASTLAAVAQDDGVRGYSGLRGSLAFGGAVSGKEGTTPPTSTKADLDVGGGGSIYWGLHLPQGFDVELEMLYRYQALGGGEVNGTSTSIGGYGQIVSPMVNAYWTAPVDFPVKPFIGGGVGYSWNEIGIDRIGTTTFTTLHDDNWRFAYNGMAGIVIPASDTSRFTVGYRWLHEDVGIDCGVGVSCSGNLNSHSIDLGYSLDL